MKIRTIDLSLSYWVPPEQEVKKTPLYVRVIKYSQGRAGKTNRPNPYDDERIRPHVDSEPTHKQRNAPDSHNQETEFSPESCLRKPSLSPSTFQTVEEERKVHNQSLSPSCFYPLSLKGKALRRPASKSESHRSYTSQQIDPFTRGPYKYLATRSKSIESGKANKMSINSDQLTVKSALQTKRPSSSIATYQHHSQCQGLSAFDSVSYSETNLPNDIEVKKNARDKIGLMDNKCNCPPGYHNSSSVRPSSGLKTKDHHQLCNNAYNLKLNFLSPSDSCDAHNPRSNRRYCYSHRPRTSPGQVKPMTLQPWEGTNDLNSIADAFSNQLS